MKIQTNKLINFLEKATLKGSIGSSLLNFTDDGLKTQLTTSNIAFVQGMLDKSEFQEYEAVGEVGIKNNNLLINLLKRYSSKLVKLEVQENKLVLTTDTGSTYYVLTDKDMVDNHIDKVPPLDDKLDGGVEINSEMFNSIKQGADVIKTQKVTLKVKDKKLSFVVMSETGDKITETLDCDYKDVQGKYGSLLFNVIDVIQGTVNVSLNDDFPIRIKEKGEGMSVKYLIAPLVKND